MQEAFTCLSAVHCCHLLVSYREGEEFQRLKWRSSCSSFHSLYARVVHCEHEAKGNIACEPRAEEQQT
jgi:hypothetical protein